MRMKKFLLSLAVIAASAFAISAQETAALTVGDGTDNSLVPLNTLYWDAASTNTQVIYNASMLDDMVGGTISSVKFYVKGSFQKVDGTKVQLSMGTTDVNTYAATNPEFITEGLTVVASDVVSPESLITEVEFVFDTPYVYNGGNLVFECKVTETTGGWKSNYFLGMKPGERVSMSRTTSYDFLPKTTFTYQPAPLADYEASVMPEALNFGKTTLDTEKVMNVTLKNKGVNAFTPAISLEAPFSTTYVPAELASKQSVEIPVKFAPTAFGEYTGTMTIDCGEAGTLSVALSGNCPNEFELTVCDGQNLNKFAPIYGYYCDTQGTFVQMIYTADMLAEAAGSKITGIKFYSSDPIAVGTPTIELALKGTESAMFEATSSIAVPDNLVTDMTTVASTTLAGTETELVFDFTEPYAYDGGNLAVQTLVAVKGTYKNVFFYGVNQEGQDNATGSAYAQWAETGGYNQMIQFLPKMTIIYTKDEAPVETVAVAGVVTDEENAPLEGVNVTLTVNTEAKAEPVTYTATTNAEGAYSMDVTPVEGATYSMSFAKEGYITKDLADVDLENVPETVVLEKDSSTAISDINAAAAVSVKYIDAMGRVSDRPFKGVNIMVTRNADGSTTTTKVVK